MLPLRCEDFDGETIQVRRTAHEGQILEGTKTDHGESDAARVVPVPATLAWMLEAQRQVSHESELLFTTQLGACGASATSTATSGGQPKKLRA